MSQYPSESMIKSAYTLAKERYATLGVDTQKALKKLSEISISLHCWQGDDVVGFENPSGQLGGGLAATGNYPGKARNFEELKQDLDKVYSLIPGKNRLNLHAIYASNITKTTERDELLPQHFTGWVDWAKSKGNWYRF